VSTEEELLRCVVTAKIEVPRGSATRVAKVIEFQANGGCGVDCGGRGYALGS